MDNTENIDNVDRENDGWEAEVREQLQTIFDAFLPFSVEGGITLMYNKYVKEQYEDGTTMTDPTKAVGVRVIVDLNFAGPVNISEEVEDGEETK